MTQNQQFGDAIHGLTYAKECLDPARYVHLIPFHLIISLTVSGYHNTPDFGTTIS